MEAETPVKPVVVSETFQLHRQEIYKFGIEMFGYFQAEKYQNTISRSLFSLSRHYNAYPECRFLITKNRSYRNIVIDAHLIIFKIAPEHIEVLDIIHKASSIKKIKKTKDVKID